MQFCNLKRSGSGLALLFCIKRLIIFYLTKQFFWPPIFLDRRQYLHIEVFVILYKKRCGHSSLVEYQLPKLRRRVRFPLSAPFFCEKRFV